MGSVLPSLPYKEYGLYPTHPCPPNAAWGLKSLRNFHRNVRVVCLDFRNVVHNHTLIFPQHFRLRGLIIRLWSLFFSLTFSSADDGIIKCSRSWAKRQKGMESSNWQETTTIPTTIPTILPNISYKNCWMKLIKCNRWCWILISADSLFSYGYFPWGSLFSFFEEPWLTHSNQPERWWLYCISKEKSTEPWFLTSQVHVQIYLIPPQVQLCKPRVYFKRYIYEAEEQDTNSPYNCIFQREVSGRAQENLLHPDSKVAKLFYVPKHLTSNLWTHWERRGRNAGPYSQGPELQPEEHRSPFSLLGSNLFLSSSLCLASSAPIATSCPHAA